MFLLPESHCSSGPKESTSWGQELHVVPCGFIMCFLKAVMERNKYGKDSRSQGGKPLTLVVVVGLNEVRREMV